MSTNTNNKNITIPSIQPKQNNPEGYEESQRVIKSLQNTINLKYYKSFKYSDLLNLKSRFREQNLQQLIKITTANKDTISLYQSKGIQWTQWDGNLLAAYNEEKKTLTMYRINDNLILTFRRNQLQDVKVSDIAYSEKEFFKNFSNSVDKQDEAGYTKGKKSNTDNREGLIGMRDNNYYVTMTDSFMSGWGEAEGKTNKLVIVCESHEEALIVKQNASNRSDMKYIKIASNKPRYNENQNFVQFKTKEDMPRWFEEGYFTK